MPLTSINPATGEKIEDYPVMTPEEVGKVLAASSAAFQTWRRKGFDERAALMRKAASVLRDRKDDLAALMAREMGKPLAEGGSEVDKCAWVCEYYAEHAASFLAREMIETDAGRSYITYQPIGPVLAVMPWNFPLWQVFRFAAPSLMAGNTGLLKHSSNVTGCALAIESVFRDAGFPDDVFRTLVIDRDTASKIIDDPIIRAATLTGSVPAGRAVAQAAGRNLKKTVMELGGSDPYLILEDADIDAAAKICVTSRLINSGQSCIAAKRFVVVDSRRGEFEKRMVEQMKLRKMGDPFDDGVDVGPQARVDLRDELHQQVRQSIDAGARCLLGGKVPDGPGAFYPPTVLTSVAPGMPAYDEELFGPVAAIIPARDEADAIRIANDSVFGLGAAVFTADVERGERIAARELDAGCCFVNDFVRSDPRLPFGGVKDSGYGRELSHVGIKEFVNIKTVWVR